MTSDQDSARNDTPEFGPVDSPDDAARAKVLAQAGAPLLSTPVPPRRRTGERSTAQARAGGLGPLDELAAWIAACQGRFPPRPLRAPRPVVFAADHGIAARRVSARETNSTADLITAPTSGADVAMRLFAELAGVSPRIIDIGLSGDVDESLAESRFKIRRSSGAIDVENALDERDTVSAVRAGMTIADAEVDAGADLLLATGIGVAASTPAATVVAALAGAEPVAVAGRGSGIDDRAWMRKTVAIRDALRRARRGQHAPLAYLRTVGGTDIAAIAGFLAQAALRRTPVLLDGMTAAAAALAANELAPGACLWWRATHLEPEPAHAVALEHLGLDPVLEFDMGAGAGAALLPMLSTATSVHAGTGSAAE
ncbi:nicotinate-nucleotide-dimethylbenzimidazole phosphoribosyltransferase [Haloechinothrix alba]|uniref:Nicotinate-nucleotide--dimethylbenzimidazole phosphoribosyltransferase n=1 Tax=Haloechinothrix alba TaxID=664784 RepID=A0A238WHL3_9PSEU|nr:nicotinate-nucleotide--dimethylbenzimidazole phosphoribosyltransferase [Haloechinothrix alba]SNR46066.1 nicotinate-nucleotide-dimethylbenzimidazole phosphoribosyltransferase [Haloechinothrix alba]